MVAAKCGHGNLFEAAFWQRTSNTTVVEVQHFAPQRQGY
jgi:hypothetical protein